MLIIIVSKFSPTVSKFEEPKTIHNKIIKFVVWISRRRNERHEQQNTWLDHTQKKPHLWIIYSVKFTTIRESSRYGLPTKSITLKIGIIVRLGGYQHSWSTSWACSHLQMQDQRASPPILGVVFSPCQATRKCCMQNVIYTCIAACWKYIWRSQNTSTAAHAEINGCC